MEKVSSEGRENESKKERRYKGRVKKVKWRRRRESYPGIPISKTVCVRGCES